MAIVCFYHFAFLLQAKEDINLDAEEALLSYECEKKPLKLNTSHPGEVDFLCDLFKGRFNVTANVNHGGKICSVKIFDKTDPEGDESSKREFKNLKTLRHEKMVMIIIYLSLSRSKTLLVFFAAALFFMNAPSREHYSNFPRFKTGFRES